MSERGEDEHGLTEVATCWLCGSPCLFRGQVCETCEEVVPDHIRTTGSRAYKFPQAPEGLSEREGLLLGLLKVLVADAIHTRLWQKATPAVRRELANWISSPPLTAE